MKTNFPTAEELKSVPVHGFKGLLQFYAEQKFKAKEIGAREAPRVLVREADFLELVETLLELKLSPRELKAYGSRLKLLPPPVPRDGGPAEYYVYPDHFDLLALVLTLRRAYHLPLKKIRDLLERFPRELSHLVIHRKISLEDLLDVAKMTPRGFAVRDVVMAKSCDAMLEDLLPPDQAVLLATVPGEALPEREERLILDRLEEIKAWVSSGRRREFLRRESAEDFRDLAYKHLLGRKISRKISARRARLSGGKLADFGARG